MNFESPFCPRITGIILLIIPSSTSWISSIINKFAPEPITDETLPFPPPVLITIRDPFLNFFSITLFVTKSRSITADLSIIPEIVSANSFACVSVGDNTNTRWYGKNNARCIHSMASMNDLPKDASRRNIRPVVLLK